MLFEFYSNKISKDVSSDKSAAEKAGNNGDKMDGI